MQVNQANSNIIYGPNSINNINSQISNEEYQIKKLESQKNELYSIPDKFKNIIRHLALESLVIASLLSLLGTIGVGWFIMDYAKVFLPSIIVSMGIGSVVTLVRYYNQTSQDRKKLRKADISKIERDILIHRQNIKNLNQQLIFLRSNIINEDIKRQKEERMRTNNQIVNMQERLDEFQEYANQFSDDVGRRNRR